MITFHVNLQGCIWSYPSIYQSFFPRQFEVWLLVLPKRWKSGPWWWWRCCYQLDRCGFLVFFCGLLCRWSRLCLWEFGCFQSRQMFSGVFFWVMIILILVLFHMIFFHICYCIIWYEIIIQIQIIRILLINMNIYIFIISFFPAGFHQVVDVHPGNMEVRKVILTLLLNSWVILIWVPCWSPGELCLFLYQPTLFESIKISFSQGVGM